MADDWSYCGRRTEAGTEVVCFRRENGAERVIPLDPRFDLWKHSPSGFEWGYSGSGPAQLALALLAHVLPHEEGAVVLRHAFKDKIVAELNHGGWILTEDQILETADALRKEELARLGESG